MESCSVVKSVWGCIILTEPNLIHARAAIQVEVEEGCDWEYAVETVQIVYNLTEKDTVNILLDIMDSIWYKDRLDTSRN